MDPGATGVDLGAGTGLLGILAAQAGAGRVVAVDRGPILDLAAAVAQTNGFDRIEHRRRSSLDLDLPRADVVVADQVDGLGADAGLFQCFEDARRRFLAPDGRLVPSALAVHVAPVELPEVAELVARWGERREGLDVTAALPWVRNQRYWVELEADDVLGPAVDGPDEPTGVWGSRRVTGTTTVARAGALGALGTWWSARLSPSVRVTNAPGAEGRVERGHVALPLDHAVEVRPGDVVSIDLRLLHITDEVAWTVRVERDGATVLDERHSTFEGRLDLGDAMALVRSAQPPRLSPSGEVQRLCLDLCDGEHTTTEIVAAVRAAFPERYPSDAAARSAVLGVLSESTQPVQEQP